MVSQKPKIDNNRKIDELETLLLMAMHSGGLPEDIKPPELNGLRQKSSIPKFRATDASSLVLEPAFAPRRAYTFDLSEDRLYSFCAEDLIDHPFDIIGEKLEVIVLHGQEMKWLSLTEVGRPKRWAAVGRAAKWFVFDFRCYSVSGEQENVRKYVAMNSLGKIIPTRAEGFIATNEEVIKDRESAILMCSIVEDAHRNGAILAEASCESSIVFPVQYGAHKSFAALREGPRDTPTKRKNPILHFVSQHIRSSGKPVKQHWRGVESIEINGINLTFSEPGDVHDIRR